MENISLIDVSVEDDELLPFPSSDEHSLLPADPRDPEELEHFEESTDGKENHARDGSQTEQACKPALSTEREWGASKKCNLRKSLAWNSAFFTNEGVLNQEELANVSQTFTKGKSFALPEILEDVRKSNNSNATFDSDGCTIESLEVDLFENSQTSIQKPHNECEKAPKKHEFVCANQVKDVAASNGHNTKQMKKKSSKEVVLPRVACIGDGERRPPPKPHRSASGDLALNRTSTLGSISGKGNPQKAITGSSGNCQPGVPSKKFTARETHASIPRSSSTAKNSCPFTTTQKMLSNATSKKSIIASDNIARNKIVSASTDKSTQTTANKLPSKVTRGRDKTKMVHDIKAHRISSSKPSRTCSRKSFDTLTSESSSSSVRDSSESDIASNLQKLQLDNSVNITALQPNNSVDIMEQSAGVLQSQQHTNEASSEVIVLNDSLTTNGPRNQLSNTGKTAGLRPSGLRLPSPKFGYFDVNKSAACKTVKRP